MNKRGKRLTLLTMATITPMVSMSVPMNQAINNNVLLSKNNKQLGKNPLQGDKIYSNEINVINVWNGPILTIGFNKNNTFKISNGGNYLNPYYTGDNSLTIKITNSNGKIIYNENFAGGSYPYSELSKALNNKAFNNGDIISITNRSNGSFDINGLKEKKQVNYMITENGLEKLKLNSIENLKAYYNGDDTTVTGNTVPNSLVTLWIGSESYTTIAGSSGSFKSTLPKTVTPNTNITVCPHDELGENVVVKMNPNIYKVERNNIELYGYWGGVYKVANIGFNAYTMKFDVTSSGNPYMSWSSNNLAYTISLYTKEGTVVATKTFLGENNAKELEKWMNSIGFKYGDYLSIKSDGLDMSLNGEPKSKKSIFVQISKGGLVSLSEPKVSIPENSIVINTYDNANISIEVNGKSYNIKSNKDGIGTFKIPDDVKIGTPIKVSVKKGNIETMPFVVKRLRTFYKLDGDNIELYGNWGGIYKFGNIGFNTYTMKFNVTAPESNPCMCGAVNDTAYTINLYSKTGVLITSKSFVGGTNANEFKQWMNSVVFKYGDYLSIKSNGLNMSLDGQAKSKKNIFIQILKDGVVSSIEPKATLMANGLIINSYKNANVSIEVNGKNYNVKTNSKGEVTFKIPSSVKVGTPISISVEKGNINTMPITVYSAYANEVKNFSYNMFRYASLSPSSKVALKGDDMTLTSLEPIPLQFSGKAKVLLDVKGDIKGKATVYINNGASRKYITTINVNTPTVVNVPDSGALIIDTSNVDYDGSQDSKFNFKINVKVQSGYYKSIPIFDNRRFMKIDSEATSNEIQFNKEIFNPANINNGAIIIGDHVRMYIPNVGESLPTTFNASNTVNWYNEAFISDNELNGLSQNATEELNKFHTNFFYVTTYTTDNGDGWWTGGGGTSAIPGMFKIGLTTPGWVMFHEVGHIFDPCWADSFGGSEIYSNMYTAETQLRIEHKASWGQGNPGYNKTNTLPIFENYSKGYPPQSYMNMNTGLEYFKILHRYFPTMMPKIDDLYRQQWYNNDLPYNGVNYLAYAMATIYHTNIIPSLNMWGCKITNQKLIKYVMENSKDTTNLVPSESYFDKYRNMTVPATFLNPQLIGNKYVIEGMVNPNARVTVQYGGKDYTVTCNSTGKFTIEFPKGTATVAKIYGNTPGKTKGYVSVVPLSKAFINNNKSFNIVSTNGCGGTMATLTIGPEGNLEFISTGANPDWEAPNNPYFMNMRVTTPNGKVVYKQDIYMHSNFNAAKKFLEEKKLPIGTIITITAPMSNSQAAVDCSSKNGGTDNLSPSIINDTKEWNIIITPTGLEYLKRPNIDITNIMKDLIINTIPESKVTLTIDNKTYSGITNDQGQATIELPKNLQAGEKVIYKIKLGLKNLFSGITKIEGFNSTLTINNRWSQSLGNIKFNYENNKIEVQKGWSEVNPYLSGEVFKLTLENKNGNIIKSFTGNGGVYIANALYNSFNGINFKVGDKFIIQYKTSTLMSFNKIITPSGVAPYDIKKSVVVYVTSEGLSLVKPKINKNPLEKAIEEGTNHINSKEYTDKSVDVLKGLIKAGENILNDTNITQSEINTEVSDIDNGIKSLVEKANIEALQKAITAGTKDVNTRDYTSATVKNLENEIAAGKLVLANPNTTQSAVNKAVSSINKAIEALKPVESGLKGEIAKAKAEIGNGNFTPDSVNNVENAINAANKVVNNPSATVQEVKNAESNLKKAMSELVKKANTEALQKVIVTGIQDVNSKNYTPVTVKSLESEIADGKLVLANPNATQSSVNNAVAAINKAIEGLKKNPEVNPHKSEPKTKPVVKPVVNKKVPKTHEGQGQHNKANKPKIEKQVNESVLKEHIELGNNDVNSGIYTPNSINALEKAINEGKAVVANKNATMEEVNKANREIVNALNNLMKKGNKENLKKAIKAAMNYVNSNDYTDDSVNSLKTAINKGNTDLSNPNLSEREVSSDIKAINEAIGKLKTNESGLTGDIAKAKAEIGSKKYTPNSVKAVTKALEDGHNVLENKTATPAEVHKAENEINQSLKSLVKRANTSELKNAIKNAQKAMNSGDYTKESLKNLINAINNGQGLLSNLNATQEEVNNEASDINNAIKELVKKETVIKPHKTNSETKNTKSQNVKPRHEGKGDEPVPAKKEKAVVNTSGLKRAIEVGETHINSGDYSKDSMKALENEIESAQDLLNNKNITQKEVNEAMQGIDSAIKALKVKTPEENPASNSHEKKSRKNTSPANKHEKKTTDNINQTKKSNKTKVEKKNETKGLVNKEKLQKLIKQAENNINSGNYTPSSVEPLSKVVKEGKEVLNNPKATKVEINNVINSVNKAIEGLKGNESGLKNEIAKAKTKLKDNKYSPSSVKNVESTINEGNEVLNNPSSTPTEIHNAQVNINKALNKLPDTGMNNNGEEEGALGVLGALAAALSAVFIFRKKR